MAVRKLSPNASISLQIMEDIAPGGDVFAIVQPLAAPRRLAARTAAADPEAAVIIEAEGGTDIASLLKRAQAKQVRDLGGGLYAAIVPVKKASILYEHAKVRFVEAQKQKKILLEKALVEGAVGLPNSRKVPGRGDGVVVGIINSGFDLSHPAFRDRQQETACRCVAGAHLQRHQVFRRVSSRRRSSRPVGKPAAAGPASMRTDTERTWPRPRPAVRSTAYRGWHRTRGWYWSRPISFAWRRPPNGASTRLPAVRPSST